MTKRHAQKFQSVRKARKSWSTDAGAPPPAAGGGTEQGGAGGAGGGGGDQGGSGEKTLTQTEVNTIVAREKASATQKAQEQLAKDLGVPIEQAKALLAKAKEKDDAEKSEAQLAREAADAEKGESEKAKLEAQVEVFNTRADRALIRAGVSLPEDDTAAETALARIRGLLVVKPGATVEEIVADVKLVKETYPQMFGGTVKTPPGSDPGRTPGSGSGTEPKTGIAAGMAKAQEEYKNRRTLPIPAGSRKT